MLLMRLLFCPARTSAANPLRTARFALHGWNAQPVRAKRTLFNSCIFFLLGCAVSPPPLFSAHPLFAFCSPPDIFRIGCLLGGQTCRRVLLLAGGCILKASGPISAANGVASRKHPDTPSCCKAAFTAAAKLSLHVKNRFCGGRQSQHLNGLKPFSP